MNIKELYFEADIRKHQQLVAEKMTACAKKILDKGMIHDASKFSDIEKEHYIDPVWELAQEDIKYGSERYKELVKQMGIGWEHHFAFNDHHAEYFQTFAHQTNNDPIQAMDLFVLLEMLCDWNAAAKRKGNSSALPFENFQKKYNINEQLLTVLRNTLAMIEKL